MQGDLAITLKRGFDVQTTQLNAAQLMGEFLGSENGKITRKIMSSEFSEELKTQHSNFLGGSAAPASADRMQLAPNDDCAKPCITENRSGQLNQLSRAVDTVNQEQKNISSQQITPSPRNKRKLKEHLASLEGQKPVAVSEEKTKEELVFADGLLVETVITRLQLPAEQRAAVQAAADGSGSISLKALTKILNDPANQASTPSGQPEVAAEKVQQLVDSLCRIKGKVAASRSARFQVKSKGSYSLGEFKGLLNNIVSQVAKAQQIETNGNLVGAHSSTVSETQAAATQSAAAAKSTPALQRATHDLVPSFSLADTTLKEDEEEQSAFYRLSPQDRKLAESTRQLSPQLEQKAPEEIGRQINERIPLKASSGIKLASDEQFQSLVRQEPLRSSTQTNAAGIGSKDQASPQDFVNAKTQQPPQTPTSLENSQTGQTISSKFIQASNIQNTLSTGEGQTATTEKRTVEAQRSNSDASAQNSQTEQTISSRSIQASNIQGTLLTGEGQESTSKKLNGDAQRSEMNTNIDQKLSNVIGDQSKIKPQSKTEGAFSQKQGQMHEELSSHYQLGKSDAGANSDRFMPAVQNEPQAGNAGPPIDKGQSLPRNYISLNESGWQEKLAQRIQSIQGQDRNHLTLELEPKELGKLSVRIETQQNQVTAFIVADNERARALLVQNSSLLHNSLHEQGLVLDQISVDIRQQSGERQASHQLQHQRKRRPGAPSISANRPILFVQPVNQNKNGDQIISLFT